MKLSIPHVLGFLLSISFAFAQEPSENPIDFSATATSSSSIHLSWEGSSGGTEPTMYLIIARKSTGGTFPTIEDGTEIADDNDFTDADEDGAVNVPHVGQGLQHQYDWTGLEPETTYEFQIYAYTGSAATIDFKIDAPSPEAATTFTEEPSGQAEDFNIVVLSESSVSLTWTGATGAILPSHYLIVAKKNAGGTFPDIEDGTEVVNDTDFSDADLNGAHNIAHSDGTNQYQWDDLEPNTTYDFEIYAYNGSGTVINFNKTSPPSKSIATLAAEPTNQPSGFSANALDATTIRLTWTESAVGTLPSHYLIVAKKSSGGAFPSVDDGFAVANDNDFSGPGLNGAHNVVAGTNQYDWTGLDASTQYDFIIYPYNGTSSSINFKITSAPTASATTLSTPPTNQPTGFSATTLSATSIRLDWTEPTVGTLPSNYLIVAKKSSGNFPAVTNGTELPDDNDFEDINLNGAVNVAYGISEYEWTGLDPQTSYDFKIYAYNGSGTTINYNPTSPLVEDQFTYAIEPSSHPTEFDAVATDATQITLSFSAANTITNADGYIILRRTGTNPTATGVVDGIGPASLSSSLPPGTTLVTTVTSASSTSYVDNTGLTTGTQYNYAIIPFNWDGSNASTYNYLTSATILTASETPSIGVTITPANTVSVCQGSSTTLTDITIAEVGKGDIATAGTVFFELDNLAYSFVPGQGSVSVSPGPVGTGDNDIESLSIVVNASRITISYTLDGNNNDKESIIISGIKVMYDGSSASSAHINKVSGINGGTGIINGLTGNLATINAGTNAAAPVVSFTPNTYCQGEAMNSVLSVTNNNTNLKWYSDINLTTEITGLANPANPTGADMTLLGFVTTSAGTITRYVTQTPGACRSTATPVTLTVNPTPTADITLVSGSSTLCEGNTITLKATPSSAFNYTFKRYNSSDVAQTPIDNGNTQNLNRTAGTDFNDGDKFSVVIQQVAGGCTKESSKISFTVNPKPVVSFAPSGTESVVRTQFNNTQDPYELNATVIPNNGIGIFSGLGVSLYPDGKYKFNPQVAGTANNPITITYSHTSVAGCTSSTSITVNVFSSSAIVNNLQSTYCTAGGKSAILSHNPAAIPAGTTYSRIRLFRASGGSPTGYLDEMDPVNYPNMFTEVVGSNPKTYQLDPAVAGPGLYYIDVFVSNGGSVDFLAVYGATTIYANPSAPAFEAIPSLCVSDDISNREVKVTSGGTISWYSNIALTSPIPVSPNPALPKFSQLSVPENSAGTFTSYMTTTINGCQSPPTAVNIVVNNNPNPPVVPSIPDYCSNDTFLPITVTGSGSATYRWYGALGPNTPDPNVVYSPTSNTATPGQLEVPNIVSSTTTYQRFVSQIVNACESPVATINIAVKQVPLPPLSSSTEYCLNASISPLEVTASPSATVRWYADETQDPANEFTITSPTNASPVELGLSSTTPFTFERFVTQTIDGCESSNRKVTIVIKDLPAVAISTANTDVDLTKICKSDNPIAVKAIPGGTWGGTAFTGLGNFGTGTVDILPNSTTFVPGNSYSLTYTYSDASTSCSNQATATVTILPSIEAQINIGTSCNGLFVNIDNESEIVPSSASSTITSYAWNFDDNTGTLDFGNGIIPDNTHGGTTKGTYRNIKHKFPSVRNYSVNYRMMTSDGCVVSGTTPVEIFPIPDANFTWTNTCLGTETDFNATISNGVSIASHLWNFNKLNQLPINSIDGGTTSSPSVSYGSIGMDTVRLVVVSTANCRDTVEKPVFITPVIPAITDNSSYAESFNTGSGGWISGGVNASWAFGKPASIIINRDSSATGNGNAWKTNLSGKSNANEQSWVLSPCFDFTEAKKPVISLDIWSDTPRGLDGAVLQYNETNNIEDDNNWIVLGDISSGVNWYDQNGITSGPGNQPSIDVGWTGDASGGKYKGWKHAVYKLDNLIGKPSIKFRIAFGSNIGSSEGFAFDNIVISERSRSILIENFTNSSATANARTQNEFFNTLTDLSSEIIGLQYHTGFPGDDPVNKLNPSMHNARAAFYGITTSPALRIDGSFRNGSFSTWAPGIYDNRVLEPSPLQINVTPVKEDDIVTIKTTITNTSGAVLSTSDLNVFTVIVEKQIDDPAYLGNSGDTYFKFVAKDILPTPAGIPLPSTLQPGETYTVPVVHWSNARLINPDEGAIVVFIQKVTATSKEVIQAKMYDNPARPSLVTDTETLLENLISIYPVPSDKVLNVALPEPLKQETTISVFDNFGKQVLVTFIQAGTKSKTISTTELASGVYILQVETSKGIMRKKISVVHGK